jgi:raffinose/stachyose/melibiose transport system permease protein
VKPSKKAAIVLNALFILFSIAQIFPFLWMINFSLKSNGEILTQSSLLLPQTPLFSNYLSAWTAGSIGRYFFNTLFVTASTVGLVILLCGMIAYAIARMRWKLKNVTLVFIMLGMMIPIHATLVPLFIVLQKLKLMSTHYGVILAYVASSLPVAVFIFMNFMRSIPYEMEAAAYIDGCGVLRTYFEIILPTIKPAIATVAISVFLNSWNEFIMAATFLQSTKLYTLSVGLTAFKGRHSTDWGPLGAAMVISCIPLIVFYALFSERIEKGFSAGSILK